jgi:hypothetical protein
MASPGTWAASQRWCALGSAAERVVRKPPMPAARRAPPPPRRPSAPRAGSDPDGASAPIFNDAFQAVFRDSIARQGTGALSGPAAPDEFENKAMEEVLVAALQTSRATLGGMRQWRDQLDAQIKGQERQVERMQFALTKAKGDAAYMLALKRLAFKGEDSD